MVLLLTKNPTLSDIYKFQPRFMGPIQVISTELSTYSLDLPPSMAAVHPWFHPILLKPAGPQPAGPLALEDDSYEAEAILQISKRGKHAKMIYIGYDSSYNQYGQLSRLGDTALEVLKAFFRGRSERELV